jgi:hypothetical protein
MTLPGPTIDFETAALCGANPLARQLRGLFHKLDRAAERGGWWVEGQKPAETSLHTLYILEASRDGQHLSHKRAELYTAALRFLLDRFEGNTAEAMLAMARGSEQTRDMVTEFGVVPSVEDAIVADLGDNWRFHGLAFTAEAWVTVAMPGSPEAAAVHARKLHTLPGRSEARIAIAFTRDGYLWHYQRVRGDSEATLVARKAGGERGPLYSGGIVNGLTRMVNSVVAQQDRHPVPEARSGVTEDVIKNPPGWVAPNTARRTP